MELIFQYSGENIVLRMEPQNSGWRVELPDGSARYIEVERLPGDLLRIVEGDRAFEVPFAREAGGVQLSLDGRSFRFIQGAVVRSESQARASGQLTAPMPGVVADIKVKEGETVRAYQAVAVVEAMKVMATIEAPFAGTVTKVYVARSQQVAHGAPLVDITPLEPTVEQKES